MRFSSEVSSRFFSQSAFETEAALDRIDDDNGDEQGSEEEDDDDFENEDEDVEVDVEGAASVEV